MSYKHPHRYGLMGMVSKKDYKHFEEYREKLQPHVKFFMEKDFFDDIAPQHISVCYFSYPEKYPKEYIKKLLPNIIKILSREQPIKIKAKGLCGWWELNMEVPALLWNITDFGKIPEIRKTIRSTLTTDITHFNDIDENFKPHIGVALGNNEHETQIKKIIDDSKQDNEVYLEIDRFMIFYPDEPEQIYPIKV